MAKIKQAKIKHGLLEQSGETEAKISHSTVPLSHQCHFVSQAAIRFKYLIVLLTKTSLWMISLVASLRVISPASSCQDTVVAGLTLDTLLQEVLK